MSQLLLVTDLMRADMQSGLEQRGLTQVRAHLIWELGKKQPVTQRELAKALDVSARNVTTLLDALEAKGFVRRSAHPTDRRAILVSLSPEGEAARERLERDMMDLANVLFSAVSRDDLDAFMRVAAAAAEQLAALNAR
ncbi:MarR family winged helix-turn-helix transcriptional regulator [Frigidibacter oleivorans]|uniref:MarR family winged helix-turn-helix transcriptional regulator n=1 Tax=Frigidibacter oleivorans TaxID=2487129 RepID=UPI0013E03EAB|nr:MarR family transcriptional regulator [Frigidibacter oleivorans]